MLNIKKYYDITYLILAIYNNLKLTYKIESVALMIKL